MVEPETVVVFRRWTGANRGVLALFPEQPASLDGSLCNSYEHVGQHGGADYTKRIRATVPARPGEYAELQAELERIGYRLHVIKAAQPCHHAARYKASRLA